jgi:asparagine synthase (glutamine-hydrolysing)
MCGIAGIIHFDNQPASETMLRRMADIMRHRGPDDDGFFIDGSIGLGHRRLSIIDLSPNGHQPMTNEDGTVWITFNGEIYNYKNIKKILQSKGHVFRSNCDTETIIHAYEEFGSECVHHLRGMFSFAIWDKKRKKFFAAVDRLRIKPLYYTVTADTFLFASELKSILASGLVKPNLNYEAIHHYLSLQAVPVPMTIYENIFTLPGGHLLEISNGQVKVERYWDIPHPEPVEVYDEAFYKERLRELLSEAVELRLMSDVPLGAFLSGGIDSTAIVAIMSQLINEPVRTFSIGYDVGGADYDDTYYAKLVSKKFRTEHKVQNVSADDVLTHLPDFLYYLDQPSSDAINSYFVSKLAAADITVVLCGQGGDELFAGYSSFRLLQKFMERDAQWEKLPAALRNSVAFSLRNLPNGLRAVSPFQKMDRFLDEYGSFLKKYARIRMELYESEKRGMYSEKFSAQLNGADTHKIYEKYYKNLPPQIDPLNKVSYLDLKTHLGDILMRDVDVMSMAFSLETRVPLIDHKLVEFASAIPASLKLKNGVSKYIFIESIRDLLPAEVVARKKLGFNFPFAIWLRQELYPLVDFVLSKEVVEERGFFRYDEVKKLKHTFRGSNITYRRVWGLVLLELWLRGVHENDRQFITNAQNLIKSKNLVL